MPDPSISTSFPTPFPTSLPSPSPPQPPSPEGVRGYRLLSGTGEGIGIVLGIENDAMGRPKKLTFVETEGGPVRHVNLRFVRRIQDGVVALAGPREGYHITRVMRDP